MELKQSISSLYTTFQTYPFPTQMEASPLKDVSASWEKMNAVPLRELSSKDLSQFGFSALTTWGILSDFKHFLPRLLELAATHQLQTDIQTVIGKLEYGQWELWPLDEQTALKTFFISWWRAILTNDSASSQTTTCLQSIAQAEKSLTVYLNIWKNQLSNQSSQTHLLQFLSENLGSLTRKGKLNGNYFSSDQTEIIKSFLREKVIKTSLEAFFFEINENAQTAQEISNILQQLEWWLETE